MSETEPGDNGRAEGGRSDGNSGTAINAVGERLSLALSNLRLRKALRRQSISRSTTRGRTLNFEAGYMHASFLTPLHEESLQRGYQEASQYEGVADLM
jgi:hypothetical protein